MARESTPKASTPAIALLLTLLLAATLALSIGPDRAFAEAQIESFSHVKKTKRALVFAPRGVTPSAVRRARVKVRTGTRPVRRKIRTRKVRRAIRSGSKVRVRKPQRRRGAIRGELRIKVAKVTDRRPSDPGKGNGKGKDKPKDEPTAPVEEPTSPEPTPEEPTSPEPTPEEPTSPEPTPEEPTLGTACLLGEFSPTSMPGSCWRPYADDSPFNRKLPANPRLLPDSGSMVSRWAAQPDSNMFKFTGGDADTRSDYDHPVYFNKPSDPVYTINCRRWTSSCEVHGQQVRIPEQARPAMGSDFHLTVVDQESGWEYDFWETEDLPRGGGVLNIGHGGRTMIDGDGLDTNATAAHFGGAAGIIRPEELAAGKIPHALFFVVECTNDDSVFPAGSGRGRPCSRIGKSNTDAPAMGQQFYLDMSAAEIDALNAPRWQKAILTAMADYGLFVGDTGGGSLKTLSGTSYTSFGLPDPWTELGDKLGVPSWFSGSDNKRKYRFDLRETVDWESKLRVVDPCVAERTC